MTERLRAALRDIADEVPSYPAGTFSRRPAGRWKPAAVAAACAATIFALPFLMADSPTTSPSVLTGPMSLPGIIGPPTGADEADDSPMGPASVLYGGQGWQRFLSDPEGDFGLVGAYEDVYRVLYAGVEQNAGRHVVLSPDGCRVALPSALRGRLSILDLCAGGVRDLDTFGDDEYATPQAWSPDGRTLAVIARNGGATEFCFVDAETGQRRRIDTSDAGRIADDGFAMAFSRDGGRLAYQLEQDVTVVDLAGRRLARFSVPERAWLAGKGAWTPDGSAVVTVEDRQSTWLLVARSPQTGAVLPRPEWNFPEDVIIIRLLGWNPQGEPVVAAFDREPAFPDRARGPGQLGYGSTDVVRVLALNRSGLGAYRELIVAREHIMSIDLADNAISSGLLRPGALSPGSGWKGLLPYGIGLFFLAVAVYFWRRGPMRWRRNE